jgi:hypothetical protein
MRTPDPLRQVCSRYPDRKGPAFLIDDKHAINPPLSLSSLGSMQHGPTATSLAACRLSCSTTIARAPATRSYTQPKRTWVASTSGAAGPATAAPPRAASPCARSSAPSKVSEQPAARDRGDDPPRLPRASARWSSTRTRCITVARMAEAAGSCLEQCQRR